MKISRQLLIGLALILISGCFGKSTNLNVNEQAGVSTIELESTVLNSKRNVCIYLPPDYEENKDIKKYPVIYFLHGSDGDNEQWLLQANTAVVLNEMIEDKAIEPVIGVFPDGEQSWYVDKMEKFIIEELHQYIVSNYSVYNTPGKTAITGNSMGGFGAAYLASRHNEIFGMSAPLSGWYDSWLENSELKNSFVASKENLKIELYCGSEDNLCLDSNLRFKKMLDDNGINYKYNQQSGGHSWSYWAGIQEEVIVKMNNFFNENR